MSALVEDLLLLARLDEHRPLESKPLRLDELAAEAVEMARAVDPSRPIELTTDEPAVVLGDDAGCARSWTTCSATPLAHAGRHAGPRQRPAR